jgi:hypothetical protein
LGDLSMDGEMLLECIVGKWSMRGEERTHLAQERFQREALANLCVPLKAGNFLTS